MRTLHLFCLLAAVFQWSAARAALTIASKGKSDYRIVIPADALPAEKYAAEELKNLPAEDHRRDPASGHGRRRSRKERNPAGQRLAA